MKQQETFVLLTTKEFRYNFKLFLKDSNGKVDQRNLVFTTEHKVKETQRTTNARKVPAEVHVSDEVMIDAMYRDPGYGKTFVHVDDPKGERKKEAFNVTPLDAKKIALQNLFKAAKLEFDGTKTIEVLTEEYQIHMTAVSGKVIEEGKAKEIPHEQVDVAAELGEQMNKARHAYKEKYGEDIPTEYANDKAFLSAVLDDPNFDAKGYIESKDDNSNELPSDVSELQAIYLNELGKTPAAAKKNDADWLKKKIEENRNA